MPMYRSQFEKLVALKIKNDGGNFEYETIRIPYTPKIRHYTPDFYIPETELKILLTLLRTIIFTKFLV